VKKYFITSTSECVFIAPSNVRITSPACYLYFISPQHVSLSRIAFHITLLNREAEPQKQVLGTGKYENKKGRRGEKIRVYSKMRGVDGRVGI
jgi:hypothetical protein